MPRAPKTARALSRQCGNWPWIRAAWASTTSGSAPATADAVWRFRLASVVNAPDHAVSQSPVHSPVSLGGSMPADSRW